MLVKYQVVTAHIILSISKSVTAILKNPANTGKTYAFTSVNGKPFSKPQSEWIEIPGQVTPGIVDNVLFEAAQKQLQVNQQKARRNMKYEYLLRGHIHCHQCERSYVGIVKVANMNGRRYVYRL